jgi:cyclic pyranopterin phosphate synthase
MEEPVLLVREPIDPGRLLAAVGSDAAGANVLFLGTTRGLTDGVVTRSLEYESHESMAAEQLARLRREAIARFGLTACAVVHRLGSVPVGEASVAIAAAAPHRREAFAAAEWLMEQIKRDVPIWKCEEAADGSREWVHPAAAPALIDRFGREHTDLRISVTDRCNLRCTYCMPLDVAFRPREELLTYEEIARVARVAAGLGIRTIRLTGGEPLVRSELDVLVRQLVGIPGIEDVALTTNGLLLAEQAERLFRAGLHRINVSLDSLREDVFEKIARRQGVERVLAGLAAAKAAGFRSIRINAVSIRGLTEEEIVPLALFCRREGFHLRFIEFMPLDAEAAWSQDRVLSGAEVRGILEREVGPLVPADRTDAGQPATDYRWPDGDGLVGFIDPVTAPFCDRCDRLRLTADGQFRNCLFSTTEWDVRQLLRGGGAAAETDGRIAALLRDCVRAKAAAHGIGAADFERPARAMYQIGG